MDSVENKNQPDWDKIPKPSQQPQPKQKPKNTFTFIFLIFIIATVTFVVTKQDWMLPDFIEQMIPKTEVQIANDSGYTRAGVNEVVEGNNKFALNLYSEIDKPNENLFFSPYSISTALAMVYEGAKNETAQQIQKVFFFPTDAESRRSSFANLYNQLNQPNSAYQLSVANALWVQNDFPILNDYKNTIQEYYIGESRNLDFKTNADQSRETINSWVESKTNNKIQDLFARGTIGPNTKLVLTNAVYFKGSWLNQFESKDSYEGNFYTDSNNNFVKTQLMVKEDNYGYVDLNDMKIAELPYEGDKLSMVILLPKQNDLRELENSISAEKLNEWKSQLTETKIKLTIPAFKFVTSYDLNEHLITMGMPTAFTDNADFSKISDTTQLEISQVVHKAFIDVNEEGTEAAGATGVGIVVTSLPINEKPIPTFTADHPFIFIIQDIENGNILFMGKMVDPTK